MQSLPVTAAPPIAPAQAPTPADNGAPQAAEPFGNVLARQRANTNTQDSKQPEGKQPASSAANANAASAAVTGNEATGETAQPVADAASTLPADMLAALMPTSTSTKSTTDNEKATPQAAAPEGGSTLPGDMLAMLLPAAATANNVASNDKGLQEALSEGGKKTRALSIASGALGEVRQAVGKKAATDTAGISEAPTQLRVQGNGKPVLAEVSANKDNTFTAALEAFSKGGAKAVQLDADTKKASVQPTESTALNSLLQSGATPLVSSPNGAAQVVQAAINTPVTHEAWGDEFNQKITWMATQHEQTAELHLNPPNLGPLDVVLKVSGDQATALFTSPHAAVREAVEQALPKLRDMMADNGIMLGNATVNDQSPQNRQAWLDEQQNGKGGASGKIDTVSAAGDILPSVAALSGRRHQGMLDTFA